MINARVWLAAGALVVSGSTFAQGLSPAKPEDAVRYRTSVMYVMSQHFGVLAAMARGDRPYEQSVAVANATQVDNLLKMPWNAFYVAGSDKVKTRAKPEVMTEKDKFMGIAAKIQEETTKLVAAANSGDAGALKTQFGAVGGQCKACHDPYRSQ